MRSLDNNNLNQVLEPGGMFNISAVPSLLNSTTTSLSESTLGIAEFVSDLTEASTLAALGIMFLTNNGDWNPCVPNKTLPDYIRFVDNSTPNRDKVRQRILKAHRFLTDCPIIATRVFTAPSHNIICSPCQAFKPARQKIIWQPFSSGR